MCVWRAKRLILTDCLVEKKKKSKVLAERVTRRKADTCKWLRRGSPRDNERHGLFIPAKAAGYQSVAPPPPPPRQRSRRIESPHTPTRFLLTPRTQSKHVYIYVCLCVRKEAGNSLAHHLPFPVSKRPRLNQSQGQYSPSDPHPPDPTPNPGWLHLLNSPIKAGAGGVLPERQDLSITL